MFAQVGPESATKAFWAEIHQVEDRWCISMSKPECPGEFFELFTHGLPRKLYLQGATKALPV